MVTKPTKIMETIDVTPTWEGLLRYYILVLQDGNSEGQKIAREELQRMAKAADLWNAHCQKEHNHNTAKNEKRKYTKRRKP